MEDRRNTIYVRRSYGGGCGCGWMRKMTKRRRKKERKDEGWNIRDETRKEKETGTVLYIIRMKRGGDGWDES